MGVEAGYEMEKCLPTCIFVSLRRTYLFAKHDLEENKIMVEKGEGLTARMKC